MRIRFVDEARLEFFDAISYYEKQHAGLGERFSREFEQTRSGYQLTQILANLGRVAIADLTCTFFPTTFPTSLEVRLSG